eukprot:11149991-Ditylum_brightwellii.AAC.1
MQSDMSTSLQLSVEANFKTSMAQMTTQISTQLMQMNASGLSSPANSAIGPNAIKENFSVSAIHK